MATKSNSSVYIGNLDERVSERVLYDILIQAGRVVDLHFPRDKKTDKPKGFAFAQYESDEVAAYAVKLFSGIITLYKRTLKFAISGQDKSTASLPITTNPTVNSSLQPRPHYAPFSSPDFSSQSPRLSSSSSSSCRFSENRLNYEQVPVHSDFSMQQTNGYKSHHASTDNNYSQRMFEEVLDSVSRTRSGRYERRNSMNHNPSD